MPNILNLLNQDEFASFYATYIKQVDNENIVACMINDLENQLTILENISDENFKFRYQDGKWSIGELIIHLCDSESVFSYRALSFARKDNTTLPGFEQNDWAENSNADQLTKKQIIGLFKTCRNHSIALFKSLNETQLLYKGIASSAPFSIRALGYIIIGHNRHHFNVLNNKYLVE